MKTLFVLLFLSRVLFQQQPNTATATLDLTDSNAVSVLPNPLGPFIEYKPSVSELWNGLCVRGQPDQPYGVFIGTRLFPGQATTPYGIFDLEYISVTSTVYGTLPYSGCTAYPTCAQVFDCAILYYPPPPTQFSWAFQAYVATPWTAAGYTFTSAIRIYRN